MRFRRIQTRLCLQPRGLYPMPQLVSIETRLTSPIPAIRSFDLKNSPYIDTPSNMGNLRLGPRNNVLQRARQRLQLLRLLNALRLLERVVQMSRIRHRYIHHHKNNLD